MLDEINSDKGKLITVYLSNKKEATAEELKDKLSIKLLEIYSVLKKLMKKNIVTKTENDTYKLTVDLPV